MKWGLFSLITQVFGEIEDSQEVKAYNASIVKSGEIPGAKWMIISTSAAVLSSIFFNYSIGTTLSKSSENNKIGLNKIIKINL